jgi:glycosyltransferase involved in cell wall biosynthesis
MVSFIVPVYNSESTIEKCLKSICEQTYKDIEIIAIDDGSKDNSYDMLEKIQLTDSRITVYSHSNRGVSFTRNYGIKQAKGKYIQFVDSDDTINSMMTEKMLHKIIESNLDFCMCLFEYPNKITRRLDNFEEELLDGFYLHFNELMDNVLLQGPCNKIYKAEIIRKYNIEFPDDISKHEDAIFNARYLKYCSRIGLYPEKLYYYNYVGGSLSNIIHKDEIESMLVFYKDLNDTLPDDSNFFKRIIFVYAIKQMEVIYRVTWIKLKGKMTEYRAIWLEFEESMNSQNGFELLASYAKASGIKNYIFFLLSKNKMYNASILYFKLIEYIKKVVKR